MELIEDRRMEDVGSTSMFRYPEEPSYQQLLRLVRDGRRVGWPSVTKRSFEKTIQTGNLSSSGKLSSKREREREREYCCFSPLIESKQYSRARELSTVRGVISDVQCFSGFISVGEHSKVRRHLFFWCVTRETGIVTWAL